MTEQEWLVNTDPFVMLDHLWGRPSDRKRLLLVVACWRDAWTLISNPVSREAVQTLERYAETRAVEESEVVLKHFEIEQELWQRVWHPEEGRFQSEPAWDEKTAAIAATILVTGAAMEAPHDVGRAWTEAERAAAHAESLGLLRAWRSQTARHANLLRHIIGNPFRPYPAPKHWPSTVVQLAEALYNGQDCCFALHDALLDAGHPELADHFRQEQWHPKGCFALDLILDKK